MFPDVFYRHPLIVLLVCLSVNLAFSVGLQHLGISQDIRDNLDEKSPYLLAFNELEDTFGSIDNAVLLLEYPNGVFNPATLGKLNLYTEWAEQLPYAYRVNSLTNSLITELNDDVITIDTAHDMLANKQRPLDIIEAAIMTDRNVVGNLVSADATVTAIQVMFQFDRGQDAQKAEIIAAINAFRNRVQAHESGATVYATGTLIIDAAQQEAVERNYGFLIPMVYLLMIVLLGAFFRSILLVGLVIGTTVLSIIAMLGFAGLAGLKVNPTSINAVSVLTGIVIAGLCHILVQISQRTERQGYQDAVRTGMRLNIKPISIASITTFFAFLSMNTSGIPPLRDLGNLVAVGIVFALINTLFLFPCLLLTFKPQIKHFSEWQMRLFRRYGEWLVAHPRGILVTSLLLTGAFALTSLNNQARDYFAKYYDESFQFRVANDFADAHLGGLYTLDYVIKAPTHGGITDVEYLRDLERFTDWLAQQPDVRHVASFIDIIKRMHKIMHDNTDASYRLPDSNALASQLLLAYELSLPDPQSLTQMIDISKTYSRVVVTIPSLPSDDIFRLESDINRWLTDNTQHFESTGLSGLIYVFSKIFVSSTLESLKSAAIALILIAMLLIMALRSLSLGLLSVIPNVLPFVFAFGIWGIFNGDLLLTTTAVIAITLGIVVDDTIHFLHKVQHFVQDEAMDSRTAVLRTLTEVGPAMVITTLAIGLGFFVLVFSAFLPTVHFGFVAALILFIALVLDLTILPAMLLVGERFWLRGNHAS